MGGDSSMRASKILGSAQCSSVPVNAELFERRIACSLVPRYVSYF